jgi:signal transduction histidine kinase
MKLDEVFALENAGWPALLINSGGTIVRANQSAVKLFGAALEGGAALLSTIWSGENNTPAEQFLAQWERSPSSTASLRFRVKGTSTSFSVSLCAFSKDQQKFFVFQLFPDFAAGSSGDSKSQQLAMAAGDTGNQGTEFSLAQKQKLDCALQLARTVSLDFNNALTSILGHTSLILSQMEPAHPWRRSLLEVEKSAGKAAEIASDLGAFSRQEKEPRSQSSGSVNAIVQRAVALMTAALSPPR